MELPVDLRRSIGQSANRDGCGTRGTIDLVRSKQMQARQDETHKVKTERSRLHSEYPIYSMLSVSLKRVFDDNVR